MTKQNGDSISIRCPQKSSIRPPLHLLSTLGDTQDLQWTIRMDDFSTSSSDGITKALNY